MMHLRLLMVDICSMLNKQLADISVAFFSSHRERGRAILSKSTIRLYHRYSEEEAQLKAVQTKF